MKINKISLFQEYKEGFVIFGINNCGIGFKRPVRILRHKDMMKLYKEVERLG